MPDGFQYDVFLSHSAQDKAVVRPLAERSRVLVFCMSTNACGSEWGAVGVRHVRFLAPACLPGRLW